MSNKKKSHFNTMTLMTVVIAVLIAAAGFGLYRYFTNRYDPQTITAPKSTASAETSVSSSSTVELPSELTDINSMQYLLNKKYGVLSNTYVPSDLTDPENVTSTSGVITVRSEVAAKLEEMVTAASNSGITILVSSGYVSYEEQEQLYLAQVAILNESGASTATPKAGYCENQLGLAVDLTDSSNTATQTVAFAETDAGKWLYEHAHEYGFILRYPQGKTSITGYDYMPWHYRYVGVDVATAMYNISPDETMEEYYGIN